VAGNTLLADSSVTFFFLAGDANRSRSVNFEDLTTVQQNFGRTGMNWRDGDFNYDGLVNFLDLFLLAQRYNRNLPAVTQTNPTNTSTSRLLVQRGYAPVSRSLLFSNRSVSMSQRWVDL
jgi:hypothetical protein